MWIGEWKGGHVGEGGQAAGGDRRPIVLVAYVKGTKQIYALGKSLGNRGESGGKEQSCVSRLLQKSREEMVVDRVGYYWGRRERPGLRSSGLCDWKRSC